MIGSDFFNFSAGFAGPWEPEARAGGGAWAQGVTLPLEQHIAV